MARTQLRVTFDAPADTPLSILSRTLEDFDTYLELVFIVADPRQDSFPIPGQWRGRRHSRLASEERPLVGAITKGSPLVVDLLVGLGAAGGFTWAVVQAIEKVKLLPSTVLASKQQNEYLALQIEEKKLDLQGKRAALKSRQGQDSTRKDPGDPVEIELARRDRDLELLIAARNAEAAWLQSHQRLSQDLPIIDLSPSSETPFPS